MLVSRRFYQADSQRLAIVRGVFSPVSYSSDAGVMVTVMLEPADGGNGLGYFASADTSPAGLAFAQQQAKRIARANQSLNVFAEVSWPQPQARGVRYSSPADTTPSLTELRDLLHHESGQMQAAQGVVSSSASIQITRVRQRYEWQGELVGEQEFAYLTPSLEATAQHDDVVQTRSLAGQYNGYCQQGGSRVLLASGLAGSGRIVAAQALALAQAPAAPSGVMDLVLAPDQMMLQIHESIGHPLELDRILGDERNFAGTSFVRPEMFGEYQYGSSLLNVSFDPGRPEELASYALDDEGQIAHRVMLIEQGVLKRPLGGALSHARVRALAQGQAARFAGALAMAAGNPSEAPGVANSRAIGWHRAPIDRMANINVEPGDTSFEAMIQAIGHGVLMRTNRSWSIDDSRNKFQFGCEWGQLIENGELTSVVRNPGYRGVSSSFWRSLRAVGDAASMEVMGTPFCGKGEPGQVIRVGHASPPCWFEGVEVFGA
jgi:predicted Zn-dependent protease